MSRFSSPAQLHTVKGWQLPPRHTPGSKQLPEEMHSPGWHYTRASRFTLQVCADFPVSAVPTMSQSLESWNFFLLNQVAEENHIPLADNWPTPLFPAASTARGFPHHARAAPGHHGESSMQQTHQLGQTNVAAPGSCLRAVIALPLAFSTADITVASITRAKQGVMQFNSPLVSSN